MKKTISACLAAVTIASVTPAFADQTLSDLAQNYQNTINTFVHYQLPALLIKYNILSPEAVNKLMTVLMSANQDNNSLITQGIGSASASPLDAAKYLLSSDTSANSQLTQNTYYNSYSGYNNTGYQQ